ncbi:MAG TPA: hypothetical protein VMT97_16935 [Terriglobales bacterium]|nr:hypothetical protein [Terriglobales bacterium]
MKTSSLIAAALVAALLSMGPFAPVMTLAQAQMQQQAQPMQNVPPLGPSDPALTSQVPGQEVRPVNPSESMLLPANEPVSSNEPTPGDATAAGFMNVVYVPGKAIICTAGIVTSTVLMVLTFGSAYRQAREVFMEGCSAPWALTADHVSGKIPGPGDPGYDPSGRY